MSTRRRGVFLLSVLSAAAIVVAALVLVGGPPEEPTETSAFDPSVPTSTHTPPPAGPADPAEEPTDPATDDSDPSDPATAGADPSDPAVGAASPSAPTLTPEERAEVSEDTSEALGSVLTQTAAIDPTVPSDLVGDLSGVASRSYLSELQSERLEFETEGWTREGSYTLGAIELIDHSSSSTGEVVTVRVCVDSSALVTRRADGEVIETSPSSSRAWNIFVLERADSADWQIVGRSFPDDPIC